MVRNIQNRFPPSFPLEGGEDRLRGSRTQTRTSGRNLLAALPAMAPGACPAGEREPGREPGERGASMRPGVRAGVMTARRSPTDLVLGTLHLPPRRTRLGHQATDPQGTRAPAPSGRQPSRGRGDPGAHPGGLCPAPLCPRRVGSAPPPVTLCAGRRWGWRGGGTESGLGVSWRWSGGGGERWGAGAYSSPSGPRTMGGRRPQQQPRKSSWEELICP